MKPIIANAELPQQTDTSTIDRFFQQAIAHHKLATARCRTSLQCHSSNQAQSLRSSHNLGVLALQMKQPAAVLAHFMAALESEPTRGQFWLSYIDALLQADQFEAARDVLALANSRDYRERGRSISNTVKWWYAGRSAIKHRESACFQ